MTLIEIRRKLVEYEKLRQDENLYVSIAGSPVRCTLTGTVTINGAEVPYSLDAAPATVLEKAALKLAAIRANILTIETMFGITR